MTIPETEELLTRKTLQIKLNVSEQTVRNLEKQGMPVLHIGSLPRYQYSEVIKWFSKVRPYKKVK